MAVKKLVVIVTHADENPAKATIPFVMANTALASQRDFIFVLRTTGVMLAVRSSAKHVRAEPFPPLEDLVRTLLEMRGRTDGTRSIPEIESHS